MATSRLIKRHIDAGRGILDSIAQSLEYGKNPKKTRDGELISAYECDPRTATAEFTLAKEQYTAITGREQAKDKDVLLYQIRQSFLPGEITPEKANQLAHELALRFTKGKHAFIICTHEDTKHVHSHIYFNSTKLDCTGKFRDFLGSGRAVRRLSDQLCIEHGLSIVKKPKRRGVHYGAWLGSDKKPSFSDQIRGAIDTVLEQRPADFTAFLRLLQAGGVEVDTTRKHLRLRVQGQEQWTRCDTLKGDHTIAAIHERIAGRPPRSAAGDALAQSGLVTDGKLNLLVDIQARLLAGKGAGYERWAKVFNLKQAAQTLLFLQENGLDDYALLQQRAAASSARFNELSGQIKAADGRMNEIAALQKHISNYSRTREVYTAYRKAGYSKKFLAEHEKEILLHKAAKQAFDALGGGKLPTISALRQEYATLAASRKKLYGEYKQAREDMRQVQTAKANTDAILRGAPTRHQRAEPER